MAKLNFEDILSGWGVLEGVWGLPSCMVKSNYAMFWVSSFLKPIFKEVIIGISFCHWGFFF